MSFIFRIMSIIGLTAILGVTLFYRFTRDEEMSNQDDEVFTLEKDAFDFSAIPVIEESPLDAARKEGDTKKAITPDSVAEKEKTQTPELPRVPPPVLPPVTAIEKKTPDLGEGTNGATTNIPPKKQESVKAPQFVEVPPALPPLDEEAILAAIVKIQCPTDDGRGKYIGSGFSIAGGKIVTAAHVVKDSGKKICDVIFPGKNRQPIHYLQGTLEDIDTIKKRHDEEGVDIAFLTLAEIAAYPEARAIFSSYPVVPYSFCADSQMLSTTDRKGIQGDVLLHYGYPSNFVDQNYLAEQEGRAVSYADIAGIKDQYTDDFSYQYKTPEFSYTSDESQLHPYMVSRVASFYGDSGGLAFNATKQCILGPHRGGTVGRGAGENYTVFPLLGWWESKK